MKPLMIGVATVAFAAAAGVTAQGHGNGNGKNDGGGHGNAGHAQVAGSMAAAAHGHGNAIRAASQDKGHGNDHAMRPQGHGNAMRGAANAARAHAQANEHGQGHGNANADRRAKADTGGDGNGKPPAHATAERGNGRAADRPEIRAGGQPAVRVLADGRHSYSERGARPAFDFASVRRQVIDGCPPGLARKHNGCQPPGLARQRAWQPDWWGLPGLSGRYYYNDGYLVRLNGDSIASYVPLLGGALAVGSPWPSYYEPVPVPDYYVDYYDLGPAGSYRYADDALYRIDPSTSAITAIAALLTGDDFSIGEPIPPGYDVYNVPYAYRDQYLDGPDAWYRYSDGYIYQVDPTTRLVTAAIEAIAS